MICPHCGAEHAEADGRFCNTCGMSVIKFAIKKKTEGQAEKEPPMVRCRYCGVSSPPPICLACGQRLPLPDYWKE